MSNNVLKWLAQTPAFRWAYRLGGIDSFPLASKDIWETMEDEVDKRAEALSQRKLNDLLSVVDQNAVVSLDVRRGMVFIGGEQADESRLQALKAEAEYFASSDLWKILYETPKSLAEKAMFISGESVDDLRKGRTILYTLSTQKNIVDTFLSFTRRQ